MDIYLVQHAEAKPEQEDKTRPLTDRGKEEINRVSRYAGNIGIEVLEIWHSGKLRAKQTAEIIAEHLSPSRGIKEMGFLSPMDDPLEAQKTLESVKESILLVGHLPHLSRLTSLLITDDKEKEIINFRMGAIVCLTKTGTEWKVKWVLTPELVF